jgi:hypothetical protein
MYKLVDLKGTVYSFHGTYEEAEAELDRTVASTDSDPCSTFVSAAPPYRIVEATREWVFNTVTNRYEWMSPTPPGSSAAE